MKADCIHRIDTYGWALGSCWLSAWTGATSSVEAYLTGFGFGEVLARVDGLGEVTDALRDRQGTTVGWLDDTGSLSEVLARDGYGVLAGPPSTVRPFGYTGHAEDPTGLVWGRARCYAPTTGSWTSEDPVSSEPRYGYVGGRPSHAVDPTGLTTLFEYKLTLLPYAASDLRHRS